MKPILEKLLRPFTAALPLVIALAVAEGFVPGLLRPILQGVWEACPLTWMIALMTAWLLTLPYSLMRGMKAHLYIWCVWILLTALAVIDIFCLARFNVDFRPSFVGVIIGTNPGEVGEFFADSFSAPFFLYVGCWAAAVALSWLVTRLLARPFPPGRKVWAAVLALFAAASLVWGIASPLTLALQTGLPTKVFALARMRFSEKLRPKPLRLVTTRPDAPHDLVIIIGESLKSSRMSLYGYPLPTTPRLDSLAAAGELAVRRDAITPAFHTVEAFMHFMSEYGVDKSSDEQWNTLPNIVDLARSAGYRTVWISNQNKAGYYDNLISRFANLCDTALWTKTQALGSITTAGFDQRILPILRSRLRADSVPTVWFIHLMGSHTQFGRRYPRRAARFGRRHYEGYPAKVAGQLASYDNSVLYNDGIVADILRSFRQRDAVAVYFSDHGLDLYETNPTTFSHAVEGNPASYEAAKSIPYITWASPSARQLHPDVFLYEQARAGEPVNTDTLIRNIQRILGRHILP